MSIIRNGIQLATTGTVDYEQLLNKPSINGTTLTGDMTIDATNIITVTSLPTSGIDQTKLYKVGSTLNWYNGSKWIALSTAKTYTAGTGISVDADGTINHSNSVTSDTVGSSTSVPQITFDTEGHITSVTPITIYPPTTVGSNGQYWKSDGAGVGTWQTSGVVEENNANLVTGGTVWQYIQDNAGTGGSGTVTLNGTATSSPDFYAPTEAGTAKQILVSKGEDVAPEYTAHASIDDNSSTTVDTQAFTSLTLGNAAGQSTSDDHSEGRIILNSAETGAHRVVGASTTSTITNTLPNSTGLLVSNGKTDGTAVGSTKNPVYISTDGVTTACGNDLLQMFYDAVHPVNEIVIGFASPTVPSGVTATWSDISSTYNNKALWIASGSTAGTSLTGLLPKITGSTVGSRLGWCDGYTNSGALSMDSGKTAYGPAVETSGYYNGKLSFDASKIDKVYTGTAAGSSSYGLVRPTSVVVHVYKRTK